jgi:Putative phage holin Dp-1
MAEVAVKEGPKKDHLLGDSTYEVLNNLALVVFPAVATLYAALATVWGLDYAREVVGTIVAIDTFLGVLVKVGQNSYDNSEAKYDGTIGVTETDDKLTYVLNLNGDPAELKDMTEARFKVGSSIAG